MPDNSLKLLGVIILMSEQLFPGFDDFPYKGTVPLGAVLFPNFSGWSAHSAGLETASGLTFFIAP